MADDINVTINNFYLYLTNLIPNVETQVMSNEATRKIIRYLLMNGIHNHVLYRIQLLNWILVLPNMSIVLNN